MDMHALCRKVAAEGAVLLKNEHRVLPFAKGTKVAVFGRAQTFYYKSGTGSGGLVHIDKEPCVIESLLENDDLVWDMSLAERYAAWVKEHPFDDGGGKWAGEPWFQEEMPLDEEVVKTASAVNDAALIVLARTAGEDHDNADEAGSYRLTAEEERMIALVTAHFDRVVVALNVGNLIDTSFVDTYGVEALLYIWQGGMEGANAFADLLSGKAAPSGKLTDTAAYRIEDYPSHANFGATDKAVYAEDVYLGYRYFETFRPEAVQFPFGFGLTYTTFDTAFSAEQDGDVITVTATVKNSGDRSGKEVVQVYYEAPCGALGNPARQLIAFAKTEELAPNETATLVMTVHTHQMASFDDSGVTGHRFCYVLESGNYTLYAGTDVRSASAVHTYAHPATTVVQQLESAMAPTQPFDRMHASQAGDKRDITWESTPTTTVDLEARIAARRPTAIAYTGDCGICLADVANGTHSLEAFVAQLSDDELAALTCGEGMNSPKATPGTGGALGGQTERLSAFGIPVCCVTDGPSGIRLDSGEKASSLPNGTLLASTWDAALVEELYSGVGKELKMYFVDALLGPGINLHRHPLCGRNFEYFSEDPLLTGVLAAAVTRGVAVDGTFSTIKHFCGNNQETNRYGCETVVSERALRELYLKPFEIAVKQGENVLIMTAYNPVNGYWTASHYDLTTTVLRGEWGFENFVMTDWWAKCNLECGGEGNGLWVQAMIRAQNDVYMVCADAQIKAQAILEGLKDGYITRGELQRSVMTICRWILRSITFEDYCARGCVPKYPIARSDEGMAVAAAIETPIPETTYAVSLQKGTVVLALAVRSDTDVLAQTPVTVRVGNTHVTFSVCGTEGAYTDVKRFVDIEEEGMLEVTVSHPDVIALKDLVVKQ